MDSGESMSESAFEALRERMRAAQAQIAAIKKEEKKQKKTEDDLLKILLKFIKTSQKTDLVLLVSRVLEKNIPANFILAVILLGNEDIQREMGDFLMLGAGENAQDGSQHKSVDAEEKALIFFNIKDETLPLKVKIKLDTWIKGLLFQAEEYAQKLLKTAQEVEVIEEKEIKNPEENLVKLLTFIVRDYLGQNEIEEPYEKLYDFSTFVLKGIFSKTEENLENRKFLEG